TFKAGDVITIDGSTGQVLAGRVPMIEPALSGEFATLMGWADAVRKLGVRANADTPNDARVALKFGAEGIGLCRTEHMFFDEGRIRAVREMILADDEKSRRAALAQRQARATCEAAAEAAKRTGKPVVPEVMVPLIATKAELDLVKASIDAMAEAVARESGRSVKYQVGTMIELPRASLRAAEIAQSAEFFSFGTNDLTQTTY